MHFLHEMTQSNFELFSTPEVFSYYNLFLAPQVQKYVISEVG